MQGLKLLLAVIVLAGLPGCATEQVSSSQSKAGEFHRIEGKGVENFYQLGDKLYSGSSPEGDEGFETLKKLGVKTILSVDGSVPQADLAAKHGLRYVHVPVGYDGIARSNVLVIVKAAETLPGPLFVHCHHGLHRGPVAAAVICEGLEGWTPAQSEVWLHAAGTATKYPGLYRTVREFVPPSETQLRRVPKKFTAKAQTPGLVQTMVQVDDHFDALKALQKAAFKPLPEHPDVTAANESLILWELFREAHRTKQGGTRGDAFQAELTKAAGTAETLHLALKELEASPAKGAAAETAFQNMTKSCEACHKAYRN